MTFFEKDREPVVVPTLVTYTPVCTDHCVKCKNPKPFQPGDEIWRAFSGRYIYPLCRDCASGSVYDGNRWLDGYCIGKCTGKREYEPKLGEKEDD